MDMQDDIPLPDEDGAPQPGGRPLTRSPPMLDLGASLMIQQSEINQQVATARKYPRDLRSFVATTKAMVQADEETATGCIYALPKREGSDQEITGPSVRFAELIGSMWGNSRYASRLIEEGDQFLTAQGMFHDLERNIAISVEVKRRITGRNGRRYGVDMIGVTAAAAMSIALRNAILKGVPGPMWAPAYSAAHALVAGGFETVAKRRETAFKHYQALGVDRALVIEMLGLKSAEEVTPSHMVTLRGVLTALRDGDTSISATFGNLPSQQARKAAPAQGAKPDLAGKVRAGREAADQRDQGKAPATTQEPQDGRGGNPATDPAADPAEADQRAPDPEDAAPQDDGAAARVAEALATRDFSNVSHSDMVAAGKAEPALPNLPAGKWNERESKLLGNIAKALTEAATASAVEDVATNYRSPIDMKPPAFQIAANGMIDERRAHFRSARPK